MTVKCLKDIDKAYIADAFTSKTQTITELAMTYSRSRRTIVRVLEELSIDPGLRKRRKNKPKVDIDIDISLEFPNHPINVPGPIFMIDDSPAPWYRKVLKFVGIRA